jgi:hypothetical protein
VTGDTQSSAAAPIASVRSGLRRERRPEIECMMSFSTKST